jgi:hypothetical protein
MIGFWLLVALMCYACDNKPLAVFFVATTPFVIMAIIISETNQKRREQRFDILIEWIRQHKRYNEFECYNLFESLSYDCRYCTNFDKMFWRSSEGYAGYDNDNLGYTDRELSKCNKWSIEEQNVFFYKLKERCEQLKTNLI